MYLCAYAITHIWKCNIHMWWHICELRTFLFFCPYLPQCLWIRFIMHISLKSYVLRISHDYVSLFECPFLVRGGWKFSSVAVVHFTYKKKRGLGKNVLFIRIYLLNVLFQFLCIISPKATFGQYRRRAPKSSEAGVTDERAYICASLLSHCSIRSNDSACIARYMSERGAKLSSYYIASVKACGTM